MIHRSLGPKVHPDRSAVHLLSLLSMVSACGCIREDGSLVPSPFQLICLTRLAKTNAAVRQYLEQRAQAEQAYIDQWTRMGCADVISLPSPLAVPNVATGCFARDFTCPSIGRRPVRRPIGVCEWRGRALLRSDRADVCVPSRRPGRLVARVRWRARLRV